MEKDNNEIDVVESVKYLLSELKKEWDKSKVTKHTISFEKHEAEALLWMIIGKGILLGNAAKTHDISFEDDMFATKCCHIYLRIAEKLDKALAEVKHSDVVTVAFDEEEYVLYEPVRRVQIGESDE